MKLFKSKSDKIHISIPQPCHEDWSNMTATEKGRHCASCNKTVTDFSLYSDKELVDFLKHAQGTICGRLNSYQLDRAISAVEQPNRSFLQKLFLGSALASWLGLASHAKAQSAHPPLPVHQNNKTTKSDSGKYSGNYFHIKGFVEDSATHQRIGYANLVVENLKSGETCNISSDNNGDFKIKVPDNFLGEKLLLICTSNGYKDFSLQFTGGEKSMINMQIHLAPDASYNSSNEIKTGKMIVTPSHNK